MSLNWPPITDDTGLDELFAIHRHIWDYVVENGMKPRTPYIYNCVFCEYSKHLTDSGFVKVSCFKCPVRSLLNCHDEIGLYQKWLDAVCSEKLDSAETTELAKQIRDITIDEEENVK